MFRVEIENIHKTISQEYRLKKLKHDSLDSQLLKISLEKYLSHTWIVVALVSLSFCSDRACLASRAARRCSLLFWRFRFDKLMFRWLTSPSNILKFYFYYLEHRFVFFEKLENVVSCQSFSNYTEFCRNALWN